MNWMEFLSQVLWYVLVLMIGLLCRALIAWIGAKKEAEKAATEKTKAQVDNVAKRGFMSAVYTVADSVVKRLGQTMVQGLKGTADWTDAAQQMVLLEAKGSIEKILGESGMERLSGWLEDAEAWLFDVIEERVLENKHLWEPKVKAEAITEEAGNEAEPEEADEPCGPGPEPSDTMYAENTY